MTLNYNKSLSRLAVGSSLAQSAIPVIVCDEKFLVCMISYGARKLFFPMQLGKNMLPLFPQNTPEQLTNIKCGVFVTELVRNNEHSTVLIVSDKISGEQYHTIVILPQIMFNYVSIPWYVEVGFENLRKTVYELMSTQRNDVKRLDLCCTHLSTLFSFLREPSVSIVSSRYASPSIYKQLHLIVNETADIFATIEGSITAKYGDDISFTTPIHPKHINILSTTLLSLLLLSASDASVHFTADITRGERGTMTFSHSITTNLVEESPIDNMDILQQRLAYLAPELASLQDLAKRLDIPLSCKTSGDELTVTYSIPICTVGTVIFHEGDIDESMRVRNLASSLIADFTYSGKKLKNI